MANITSFIETLKQVEILDWKYQFEELYIAYAIRGGFKQTTLDYDKLCKHMVEVGLCEKIEGNIIHLSDTKNGLAAYFEHDFMSNDAQHLIASIESNKAMSTSMSKEFWRKHSEKQTQLQTLIKENAST